MIPATSQRREDDQASPCAYGKPHVTRRLSQTGQGMSAPLRRAGRPRYRGGESPGSLVETVSARGSPPRHQKFPGLDPGERPSGRGNPSVVRPGASPGADFSPGRTHEVFLGPDAGFSPRSAQPEGSGPRNPAWRHPPRWVPPAALMAPALPTAAPGVMAPQGSAPPRSAWPAAGPSTSSGASGTRPAQHIPCSACSLPLARSRSLRTSSRSSQRRRPRLPSAATLLAAADRDLDRGHEVSLRSNGFTR